MMRIRYILAAILALVAAPAQADNIADCEILLMELIADEAGNGGMQIANYRPAGDYIASVYDDEPGHMDKVGTLPIRALMCQRNDVVPVEKDYALLATGIPFILSQDFDSPDTDSLTIYWKDDHFDYVYRGEPLAEETQDELDRRLTDFGARDHGLNVTDPEADEEEPLDTGPEDAELEDKQ